jgi:hypothetical protein
MRPFETCRSKVRRGEGGFAGTFQKIGSPAPMPVPAGGWRGAGYNGGRER